MENKEQSVTVQMEVKEEILPVVGPVIIEFIGDVGVEDSLLDISDILTLSVSKLQDHPLAKIVFYKSNPHVKQIKEVVGKDVEKAEVLTNKVDPIKEKESRKVKRKQKAKESKKTFKKAKTHSNTTFFTPKIRERKIPVSTKDIYRSRKLVPLEEFEAEMDWMMIKRKLDDIVDLNLGEKTMMNLWNKNIAQYQGRGICHMDKIAKDFLTERSHTIVEQNLYRNYVTHLCGLHHINAITRKTLFSCISNIQEVMQVLDQTKTVVGPTWISQHEAAVKISDLRRNHSSSYEEKDLEAASCLSQSDKFLSSVHATVLPKRDMKRKVNNDETIHVLTEEPPNDKDFIKMQMDVRTKATAQVKNLDPSRVLIIHVGDEIVESMEDVSSKQKKR